MLSECLIVNGGQQPPGGRRDDDCPNRPGDIPHPGTFTGIDPVTGQPVVISHTVCLPPPPPPPSHSTPPASTPPTNTDDDHLDRNYHKGH